MSHGRAPATPTMNGGVISISGCSMTSMKDGGEPARVAAEPMPWQSCRRKLCLVLCPLRILLLLTSSVLLLEDRMSAGQCRYATLKGNSLRPTALMRRCTVFLTRP